MCAAACNNIPMGIAGRRSTESAGCAGLPST